MLNNGDWRALSDDGGEWRELQRVDSNLRVSLHSEFLLKEV